MDRSLKWRTLALLVGLLLCAGLLAPTWPGTDALPSWFPFQKKISLGLDLQGGVHIVYSIDLNKAVDDKASEVKRDLEARFTDEKIDAKVTVPPVPVGAIAVVLSDTKKKAEIESQVKADYPDTIEDRPCGPDDGANALCFKVSTSYAEGLKKSALSNAVNTIRERINERGVSEPSVVEKGDDIIVELPGDPHDAAMQETRALIANTAKLEFKVVEDSTECRSLTDAQKAIDDRCTMYRLFTHVGSVGNEDKATDPKAVALGIVAHPELWRPEEGGGGQRTDYYLLAYDRDETVPVTWARDHGCVYAKSDIVNGKVNCRILGQQLIERYLKGDDKLGYQGLLQTDPTFKIPPGREILYEKISPDPSLKERRNSWRTYYLDRTVRLTGSAIASAAPSNEPNTGRPVVLLDFNRYGSRVFGDLTAQIIGKKLATILDGKVTSAPIINTTIHGRAEISMGERDPVRAEQAREEMVNVLKTGSLPAPLVKGSESEVGPTLGRDAIEKTKLSFIIGICLVIVIMVGVYRWSGWIAVFAVVFHIVMTLAVMAAFGATLTLPGVAAIVLSIGMEVDGNILIYERIRDELLLGKSVRGAIDLGFSRAFSAILDGQLTTATAGWVLLQYGSGPIKGFAVMLLVGVFTTLSTNIWVTRIFFDWYVSRKKGQLATISI
jgi:preprotein translocase subunit SecD